MKKPVKLPVLIGSIASKVDGSIKITMETREITGEDAAQVFDLRGSEAWAFLAPEEIKEVELPEEKPDPSIGKKTQSQRLRNVIYIMWQQKGAQGNFEQFYNQKMETIIEQMKERLDG